MVNKKSSKLKKRNIYHQDYIDRAKEYGLTPERYQLLQKKGTLPIRRITKKKRTLPATQQASEVITVRLLDRIKPHEIKNLSEDEFEKYRTFINSSDFNTVLVNDKTLYESIIEYIKIGKTNIYTLNQNLKLLVDSIENSSGQRKEDSPKNRQRKISSLLNKKHVLEAAYVDALKPYVSEVDARVQEEKEERRKTKKLQKKLDEKIPIKIDIPSVESITHVEESLPGKEIELLDNENIEYDIIDSEVLERALEKWPTEELQDLWVYRTQRINTISDACKLLAELRFREVIDQDKKDPKTFYKAPQIQELLEYLYDDYNEVVEIVPAISTKRKALVTQTIREGQATFRKRLLDYYGCKCMVTGETIAEVIEAAHIHDYDGQYTNEVGNGMLLRSDIHKLFDRGLIAIHPEELTIYIDDSLKGSGYSDINGKDLILDRVPVFNRGIFSERWSGFK